MADSLSSNLVATRGNRCTATILGYLEASVYEQFDVPKNVQRQVRQVVLDSINGYKDLVIDIVKSNDSVMNDMYVSMISEIHDGIADLKNMFENELYENE